MCAQGTPMCPDATFITVITDGAGDTAGRRGGWGQKDEQAASGRQHESVSVIWLVTRAMGRSRIDCCYASWPSPLWYVGYGRVTRDPRCAQARWPFMIPDRNV